MLATLIVSWRTESTRRIRLQCQTFQIPIKREIEIEPSLFSIGDHIQTRLHLVVDCRNNGVVLQFPQIMAAELIEILRGEFQPPWKWVTSDHSRSQGNRLHRI